MKLSYKFLKKDNGSVVFKGLLPENIFAVDSLLVRHGFTQQTDDTWVDFICPQTFEVDSPEIDQISRYVPLRIVTTLSARGYVKFYVKFDVADEVSAPCLETAIPKAHKKWNSANRPVLGYYMTNELDKLVSKINVKRGEG